MGNRIIDLLEILTQADIEQLDRARAHAAQLATGRNGGTPLPLLSRSMRNKLKRIKVFGATNSTPHQGSKEMQRRLRQVARL